MKILTGTCVLGFFTLQAPLFISYQGQATTFQQPALRLREIRLDGSYKGWQMKTKDLQSTVNLLKLGQIHKMLKENRKENSQQGLVYSYSLHFYLSFTDTYGIVTLLSLYLDGLYIIPYCFKTMVRKWGKICF